MLYSQELHDVLLRLLHGIRSGKKEIYQELVSDDLTCFEPETKGAAVQGLDFHFFFIENFNATQPYHLELVNPTIRVYGDVGYTAYTLILLRKKNGEAAITKVNETRIFKKFDGNWKMVHFHRSDCT